MQTGSTSKRNVFIILTAIAVILSINAIIRPHQPENSTIADSSPTTSLPLQSNPQSQLVPCTSKMTDIPKQATGWDTFLYPAAFSTDNTPTPAGKTEVLAQYSLKKLLNQTEVGSIYYWIQQDKEVELPPSTQRLLEICNRDNLTMNSFTTATASKSAVPKGVMASVINLDPQAIPYPGKYRIDAYIYANDTWTLTDRINEIVITE